MFNHIGITINNSQDIDNFYRNILLFDKIKEFNISQEMSNSIFNVNNCASVYLLQYKDMVLEVFLDITYEKQNTFSHICINYPDVDNIYNHSCECGYKCYIKQNSQGQTYFISDRSGNIFEIKKSLS